MDIWTTKKWKKFLPKNCRKGLRTRFDQDIPLEIKKYCQLMCKWLQYYWEYPIRIPIYFKKNEFIRTSDGDKCYAIFFATYDHSDEPYIKIALGDYEKRVKAWGKEKATANILLDIPHELTHYFQWINGINLTEIGKERQAKRYARTILEYFLEECTPEIYKKLYNFSQ